MMNNRIKVGYVCGRGNHVQLVGQDDYGSCGTKQIATIWIEADGPEISLSDIREAANDLLGWVKLSEVRR
jgi:hypothetical protein